MPGDASPGPTLNLLTQHLLAVKQSLTAQDIAPGLLLLEDLGLDSMDLAALAARIRADVGEIDFMPWLARAMAGEGTVASLAEFLTTAGSALGASSGRSA